ncbi:hypothetical protein [Glycomyces buryatensis]|uniref:hypothetical protein n=1 Tax=Glycomyces buryatensis TaxID=2570927 RepID=UPI0014562F40|nr:hypothetical protein [Glycomyces buryatensis]
MSNTPQPPADGWQPPPQSQPPVYRPNEQPPAEEPPPWSPESQHVQQSPMSQPMSQQPMSQPMPVEDVDGTIKYGGNPNQSPPPFGPPPGVPVSPFDSPGQHPGMPVSGMPGMPVSGMPGAGMPGMPAPGMPPVSSVPASGMPVSPGQGQFGPQGGQLAPVSGPAGGQQPWGGAQPIQRKKKGGGGKGPMWLLLIGVVVVAAALGIGGFIVFNPLGDEPTDPPTGTIETPAGAEPVLVNDASAGLKFVLSGESAEWAESTEVPPVFATGSGRANEDGTATAFVGQLNAEALGATEDSKLDDLGAAFDAAIAEGLGGEIDGDANIQNYWIDARQAQFHTFTVGDTTVYAAIVQAEGGLEGFVGTAQSDAAETVEAVRNSLRYGEL